MMDDLQNVFPRSANYGINWVARNEMGPNVLWLTEYLTKDLSITNDMRILDLGCGKAVSSIFLAREYGAKVWAVDLWISPTENYQRISEANLGDSVYPIYAEARQLPFAEPYFDLILSVDAYHYFGAEEDYLPYILKYLKPGGTLGILVPGIKQEFDEGVPAYIEPLWEPELSVFHAPVWWKKHFEKTGLLNVTVCDYLEKGWDIWRSWEQYLLDHNLMNPGRDDDLALLDADNGRNLCFPRIIGTKNK